MGLSRINGDGGGTEMYLRSLINDQVSVSRKILSLEDSNIPFEGRTEDHIC